MREVKQDIQRWQADAQAVVLATVVKTWGSAPRKVGAKMALTPAGQISGSVSGGCVEGAVFEAGVATLEAQTPELLFYGVADETAWDVGLACGGKIEVFVEPLTSAYFDCITSLIDADEPMAVGTLIQGPPALLGRKYIVANDGLRLGPDAETVDADALAAIVAALETGRSTRTFLDSENSIELFVDVILPKPTLIMVGGVHIAIALTQIARTLGYNTIVVDPRRAFGSAERFDHADQLIQKWPKKAFVDITLNQASAVALLTHDPKIDDPALHVVLPSNAFYIGALGSNKTHAKRVGRLREAGFDETAIARIHGPIGVDINAQTPEEIAVAIMAEIIRARRGA